MFKINEYIETTEESLTSIGTRRLRNAGGLPSKGMRRVSTVNSEGKVRSTINTNKRQSAFPLQMNGMGNLLDSGARRSSVAPSVASAGERRQAVRQSMTPRQSMASTPDNRKSSEFPTRRETLRRGTVTRSSMPTDDYNGLSANEAALMNFANMETIEDFSARILQAQKIRFQSKRQILKLMLPRFLQCR